MNVQPRQSVLPVLQAGTVEANIVPEIVSVKFVMIGMLVENTNRVMSKIPPALP